MIELLFKTITQQSFTIEVEETATVGDVKRKVEETQGSEQYPAGNQKLIFNGRILEDGMLISELNIVAPKFIVIMVVRKPDSKSAASVRPTTSASAVQKKTADGEAPKDEKSVESKDTSKSLVPSENVPLTGQDREAITRLVSMGFPESLAAEAYIACDKNEEMAANYILGTADSSVNTSMSSDGLGFLAQSPQFQQLREMVRANPEMLPSIMTQIAATNPQLMDAIRTNRAEFLNLLNSDAVETAADDGVAESGQQQDAAQRRVDIPVTVQDREVITRLVSMGFPEPLVVEAYLACDKNEELAINYILTMMDEQAEQQGGQ